MKPISIFKINVDGMSAEEASGIVNEFQDSITDEFDDDYHYFIVPTRNESTTAVVLNSNKVGGRLIKGIAVLYVSVDKDYESYKAAEIIDDFKTKYISEEIMKNYDVVCLPTTGECAFSIIASPSIL